MSTTMTKNENESVFSSDFDSQSPESESDDRDSSSASSQLIKSSSESDFEEETMKDASSNSYTSISVPLFDKTENKNTPPVLSSKYDEIIDEMISDFYTEISTKSNWSNDFLVDTEQVQVRTSNHRPFCFKVDAQLNGTSTAAFNLLSNLNLRSHWDSLCDSLEVIEEINPLTVIYHLKLKATWPVTARDSCLLVAFRKLSEGTYISVARSIEHPDCPESSQFIRMHTRLSVNLMTQQQQQHTAKTKNSFTFVQLIDADPKGTIPSYLVKKVSSKSFPATMKRIQENLKLVPTEDYYDRVISSLTAEQTEPEQQQNNEEQLITDKDTKVQEGAVKTCDVDVIVEELKEIKDRLDSIDDTLKSKYKNLLYIIPATAIILTSISLLLMRQRGKGRAGG